MKAADIAVAVPVRNEAERLPGLLAALAAQQQARPFTLCLFFDQCSDGSEAAVAALTPSLRYRIVTDCCDTGAPPNAGRARRRACELAVATVGNGVLLTTDADSTPAPDWIAANLAALDHSDIVAGRIVRDAAAPSPRQDQLEAYYDRLHALRRTLDPVAWEAPLTHHWTSAASLAMTALTYRALGGFATVATGEDAALADAAARLGFRLRRDAAVRVRTSARRTGRIEGGFATTLAALDTSPTPPLVAHPDDEAWRYRWQAEARRMDGGGERELAVQLGLPIAEVSEVAAECPNGEAFAARIVGAPPGGMRQVPLNHAAMLLELQEARLAGAA